MQKLLWLISSPKKIVTIISIVGILIILLNTNKVKINVLEIIKKHLCTLRVYGNNKISINDIVLFFMLPIFVAILLTIYINLDDTRIGIIVTIFTIFIGLLFNILAILLAFDNNKNENVDKIYIKELLYNVSFSIIVAIGVLSISMLRFLNVDFNIYVIIDFLLLYLITVFILSLFMVLKRMFNLLIQKINN